MVSDALRTTYLSCHYIKTTLTSRPVEIPGWSSLFRFSGFKNPELRRNKNWMSRVSVCIRWWYVFSGHLFQGFLVNHRVRRLFFPIESLPKRHYCLYWAIIAFFPLQHLPQKLWNDILGRIIKHLCGAEPFFLLNLNLLQWSIMVGRCLCWSSLFTSFPLLILQFFRMMNHENTCWEAEWWSSSLYLPLSDSTEFVIPLIFTNPPQFFSIYPQPVPFQFGAMQTVPKCILSQCKDGDTLYLFENPWMVYLWAVYLL